MCAALIKAFMSLLGPDVLGWISTESNLYILLDFVYDAGFYFLPIYVGYTAAKKLNTSIPIGMFLGGILIAPDLIVLQGAQFDVYGIPCLVGSYANSLLPILLSVWVMSYIHKYVLKYMPTVLSSAFTPLLTVLITLPLMLCCLAPIGAYGAEVIVSIIDFSGSFMGGIPGLIIFCALWEYVIMTGMHVAPMVLAISLFDY